MNFYQYLNLDNLGKIKLYEEIFCFLFFVLSERVEDYRVA